MRCVTEFLPDLYIPNDYLFAVQAEEAVPEFKVFKNQWAVEFLAHQSFGNGRSYKSCRIKSNMYRGRKFCERHSRPDAEHGSDGGNGNCPGEGDEDRDENEDDITHAGISHYSRTSLPCIDDDDDDDDADDE